MAVAAMGTAMLEAAGLAAEEAAAVEGAAE